MAAMCTTTSCSPGVGTGSSTTSKTSGPPYLPTRMAFMSVPFPHPSRCASAPDHACLDCHVRSRLVSAEPLLEGGGTKERIGSGSERLIVQQEAIVARIAIHQRLACVARFAQVALH